MSSVRKCLVWDLDNTVWEGVCLEGQVRIKREVVWAIEELDRRGILHSIASRGDADLAMKTLKDNNLDVFFLVPQINWLPKSQNIITISNELQLSLDAVAFIDDDRFEREQVAFMLPDVMTIDSGRVSEIPNSPEFSPITISREAQERRKFYQAEMDRKKSQLKFKTREEFLLSCAMKLKIREMKEEDVPRVLELMTRTHQLNTTGLILDQNQLQQIVRLSSARTTVTVAELSDNFGWYGIIGISLIEARKPLLRLKYLAVSCRVMGRGIERALLSSLVHKAAEQGFERIEAEFRDTGRNKMMRALYQMMGFRIDIDSKDAGTIIFRAMPREVPEIPSWVNAV
jgi:FkbH-like protein